MLSTYEIIKSVPAFIIANLQCTKDRHYVSECVMKKGKIIYPKKHTTVILDARFLSVIKDTEAIEVSCISKGEEKITGNGNM